MVPSVSDQWTSSLREQRERILQWWRERSDRYPELECEAKPWGLRWMRTADKDATRLVPILEVRPMKDGRWVALCVKYSRSAYSRNVFSYGGMFIKNMDDSLDRFEDALAFLQAGFSPSQRPVTVRKTLRIDLKELHEAGQEGYAL